MQPGFKAISFTFDDTPISSFVNGGKILTDHLLKGTYYVSLNLLGKETPIGQIINTAELLKIFENGHEIGCHTADHLDSWYVSPEVFEKSIQKNAKRLNELIPNLTFSNFSFPNGSVTPKVKRIAQNYFNCCRGIQWGINRENIDLNLLKAIPLYSNPNRSTTYIIEKIIDSVNTNNGWLIFYTHDINYTPKRYGCTIELFENVVKYALKAKIPILTVKDTLSKLINTF